MKSQHETNDHDVATCDDCVIVLKNNHRLSQAIKAAHKRKREETHSTPANSQGIECHKKKVRGGEKNAFTFKEVQVECQTTHSLNEESD